MNETFSFSSRFPSIEEAWSPQALISTQSVPYLLGIILAMLTTYSWATSNPSLKKLPYVNAPSLLSSTQAKASQAMKKPMSNMSLMSSAQRKFQNSAQTILRSARKQYPNRPYRMTTDLGEVVMLQSEWFQEIRNNSSLSFFGTVPQERMCEIPGFKPFAALGEDGVLLQIIARKQLTKLLAQVTAPLSEEIAFAVALNLGESTESREIILMPVIRDITARMSSRVFLGQKLARDEAWLQITKGYTVDATHGLNLLAKYPVNLRPYIGWLFPECRRMGKYYKRAKDLIDPVMKERDDMRRAAAAASEPAPVFHDALEWIVQESKALNSGYDAATFQLIMSVVAISTTADTLHSILVNLIQHPEFMQTVREEIIQVLKAEGWNKTSLYNMKALDSAMKESQRIKPIFLEADTKLSDGTVLKKGYRVHIDTHRMMDPEIYEAPEEWRGDRFLQLRSQPGKEHGAQLVATSVDHFAFGHGEHACPGRFFAAIEMKVALCHLLIKYDWELAPGTDTSTVFTGFSQRVNHATKVLCRKRETVEIDIDSI
ncbi:hypothetical protein ONZ43_g6835 [Nemania bipapillata]|uniref:Uncharacterized protein n=1 Tax=Nemania bipapillata TaxID=110536 RepID=A0ACC2HVK1_9PEZI|nr:hypothetical protein ONZ43_g6835 [Nemania bipapillata]